MNHCFSCSVCFADHDFICIDLCMTECCGFVGLVCCFCLLLFRGGLQRRWRFRGGRGVVLEGCLVLTSTRHRMVIVMVYHDGDGGYNN